MFGTASFLYPLPRRPDQGHTARSLLIHGSNAYNHPYGPHIILCYENQKQKKNISWSHWDGHAEKQLIGLQCHVLSPRDYEYKAKATQQRGIQLWVISGSRGQRVISELSFEEVALSRETESRGEPQQGQEHMQKETGI